MSHMLRVASVLTVLIVTLSAGRAEAQAQPISQRGFVEARGYGFAQKAPNDPTRGIGDLLVREEIFLKPSDWIQFAAGADLRANSHDQVEDSWDVDIEDRGIRRPRLAIRRLSATVTRGGFTLDVGKQFIRWGRADVLNPTDRFAPRDFLNVIDSDFLPVLGVRPLLQVGKETFEVVWVPRLTPSRLPLFDQRWTVLPAGAAGVAIVDGGSNIPDGSQYGVRWNHTGTALEASLSFFDGFNHLANVTATLLPSLEAELKRQYPDLRAFGGDVAIPGRWLTLKAEAEYFTSPSSTTDEYVLYVLEAERQVGEWIFVGGYAGEAVTKSRGGFSFAPDRGTAKSFVGRAAYTVDPKRTITMEGAVRQNGKGLYVKSEYSQTFGQHWRLSLMGIGLAGDEDDFLGQYHRNSHASASLRFSF